MAVTHNFRSAIGGFHREDVVRYIEYMNTKHATQVNQLQNEANELRAKIHTLDALVGKDDPNPELEAQCATLSAQLEEMKAANAALESECALLRDQAAALEDAQAQIQALKAQMEQMNNDWQAKELDAYRRAERTERLAQERADRIYQQAAGTLAQATTHVDTAADLVRQIADRVNSQMEELQQAVVGSKNALQDAAATMYSIRTEE